MYEHASHAELIAPSDTADLGAVTHWLSFTNSGAQTLRITTLGGEDITLTGLPSGFYPIRAKRVWSAGTTVTNVAGYWN